jgi:cytidylate kinase
MIIAIDGPAGSGKSTVAKLVAERLGFLYLDTGAMYRAVACRTIATGHSPEDEEAAAAIAVRDEIAFSHVPGVPLPSLVSIAGVDVTDAIRTPLIDDAVTPVSKMARVREALVAQQRNLAQHSDIVVEGRDIGTVVFPKAELKVYLTASPEERARRRTAQQAAAGIEVEAAAVQDALMRRDTADSTRDHSPLSVAADAIEVDTTEMTLDEVVDRIAGLARERSA